MMTKFKFLIQMSFAFPLWSDQMKVERCVREAGSVSAFQTGDKTFVRHRLNILCATLYFTKQLNKNRTGFSHMLDIKVSNRDYKLQPRALFMPRK